MGKRPELVVLTGDLKGRHYEVAPGATRLGRSSSNDIHVPDEELSRNHCIFEQVGEDGIRLTDLASANGTYLNGKLLGNDPVDLKLGDKIRVGDTLISVGEPHEVDLGLGAKAQASSEENKAAETKKPSTLMNVILIAAIILTLGAIVAILCLPEQSAEVRRNAGALEEPVFKEVTYEKVRADSTGIFRYALTAEANGKLEVRIDDTTNNRHVLPKSKTLSSEGLAELKDILSYSALSALDGEYSGLEPEPPALDSYVLKVVYSNRVKTISVRNTIEPNDFAAIRQKLEAFSKSELGVWAIAYSRERLIELAESAVKLGEAKWDDRDVNHGNLSASIIAFEEALFYLETVDPKPPCHAAAVDGLARSKAELDKRYIDQRFLADRALNLSQWENAREELRVLLEMIPDRKDPRNRDAAQKLISAETNLKMKGAR